jgi:hypothetical protein
MESPDWCTEHLNFVYGAIVGYYNGVQAARKGCPWTTSFNYSMQGAVAVTSGAALFAPWGEITQYGYSRAGRLLTDEGGYIGLGHGARVTKDVERVFSLLKKYHGIDPKVASVRLHDIKGHFGYGPNDDLLFDLTGNVYDPIRGEWLGSLTEGGAQPPR